VQERAPSPVVSDVLRCVWSGDLGEMAVPIPDECVDIIWVAGQLWAPGSPAVGVRFRPGHGPRVLQVGGAELTDVCVPVTALDRGVRVQNVLQRAAHRGVVDVHALETLVATLACDAWPVDPVAAELGVRICRGTVRCTRSRSRWDGPNATCADARVQRSGTLRRHSRGSSASIARSGWHADRRVASPSWP
jgi:hypothetical protein